MAEVLLATGAVALAAYTYGRKDALAKAKKEKKKDEVIGASNYYKSHVPVLHVSDALWSNSVRGKAVQLLEKRRGAEGSVKYIYYVPASNVKVMSYAPLEMHQAK